MFASTKFPRMKAVVWFHTNKEKDWRIDSSSASLAAFKANLAGGVYQLQRSKANASFVNVPIAKNGAFVPCGYVCRFGE